MKTVKMLTILQPQITQISQILVLALSLLVWLPKASEAAPIGTAFTYQGRLIDANNAADGLYDFQFKLFDANSDGNQLGLDVNTPDVDVIDGYFTVELDFGADPNSFNGDERWLDIGVRPGELEDPNVYTVLIPRQAITPTPYALYAKTAGSASADSDWIISGNDMYSGVSGNIGIGKTSPAAKLDVAGDISAASVYKIGGYKVLSVPGTENTFVGLWAGAVNTGLGNTFSGCLAGSYNTTGNYNTFSGYRAGYSNTEGIYNTFSGSYAGYKNTTGYPNTFSGGYAGYSNTTGNFNTFLGYSAGTSNTTGSYNTFSGHGAGSSNTTGNNNTFTGWQAGRSNTTGNYNTFSGYFAGYSNSTGSGNVFLGYRAGYNETGSNKLYIANSDVNPPLIYGDFSAGNVGIGTTNPTAKLDVAGQVKITGGSPAAGKVLTSDTVGLATWQNPSAETDPQVSSATTNSVPKWNGTTLVDSAVYDSSGNVGIGTTSPDGKLDIYGAASPTTNLVLAADYENKFRWRMKTVDRGNAIDLDFTSSDASDVEETVLQLTRSTSTRPEFAVLTDDLVVNNGNVGIGTTGPSAKLDVAGDISTTSVYKIGGETVLSIRGIYNTFLGSYAGYSNDIIFGTYNTFLGDRAGYSNTIGGSNTFSGYEAGYSNTSGYGNTFSGYQAGLYNTTGYSNTFLGASAGAAHTTGNRNTFLGCAAGYYNTGSGNVFLGYLAGLSEETGSNKLYIANSDAYPPLIYGDFSTARVGLGTTNPDVKLTVNEGTIKATTSATGATAVIGVATGTGNYTNYGGYFESAGQTGRGVYGKATGDTEGIGAYGDAPGTYGRGVYGGAGGTYGIGVAGYGKWYDFYAYGPGTDYGPFTGGHEVKLSADFPVNTKPGMIVSATGKAEVRRDDDGKITISSTLPTVKLCDVVNDKAVFGVFVAEGPLPKNHWYKNKKSERFATVNALGEGRVWVCNINGKVEVGDYITTSPVPGYGQKQNDDLLRSCTLGKATESVNWDPVTETIEFGGRTYKVYLIAVVYTSG